MIPPEPRTATDDRKQISLCLAGMLVLHALVFGLMHGAAGAAASGTAASGFIGLICGHSRSGEEAPPSDALPPCALCCLGPCSSFALVVSDPIPLLPAPGLGPQPPLRLTDRIVVRPWRSPIQPRAPPSVSV